jgi:1,4-dihydroxy-6-naphthoate synthase
MMTHISLAFSPCPNDTFIFWAMTHGKVDTEGLTFKYRLDDVETLNRLAFAGGAGLIKVSYHAWLMLRGDYVLLDSGSALGFRNGPLLVSLKDFTPEEVPHLNIAIPGEYTTANLLMKIAFPEAKNKKVLVFSEIEQAILNHEVDAGVIIHESRFTYQARGLRKILDLGEFWEQLTHLPLPLGGIIAKKSLGENTVARLGRIMKRSVVYARDHPDEPMEFVRAHAREMDETVMRKHIALYVTDHTADLGADGRAAVQELLRRISTE